MKLQRAIFVGLLVTFLVTVPLVPPAARAAGGLEQAPEYEIGSYWISEAKGRGQRFNLTIVDKLNYRGYPAYEARMVSENLNTGRSQKSRSTLYIGRDNLRFLGVETENTSLNWDFSLVEFPLYEGKKWNSSFRFQEFADSPVSNHSSSFEVVGRKSYDYVKDKDLDIEEQAFKIRLTILDTGNTFYYHFVPPSEEFPGSSIFDVYEETEARGPPKLVDYGVRDGVGRQPVCGNGIVEEGEECDGAGTYPDSYKCENCKQVPVEGTKGLLQKIFDMLQGFFSF